MIQIKPDLIVIWPSHLEYPGFRIQLKRDQHYFSRIVIGLNNCNYNRGLASSMTAHLQKEMSGSQFVFVPSGEIDGAAGHDWVTKNLCALLNRTTNEWILLMQQDFILHNQSMLDNVLTDQFDILGRREGQRAVNVKSWSCGCVGEGFPDESRWEPDFLLVRSSLIKNSSRNFANGPHPMLKTGMDSLGPWSIEVNKVAKNIATLHSLDYHIPTDYEHLRAFTEAYHMIETGNPNRVVGKERFARYHKDLLSHIGEINIHPSTQMLIDRAIALT